MKFLHQICLVLLFSLFTLVATAQTIDINTATAEELATLDGVGPAKAAAIIEYREVNGPFTSVDDLANVKGIGGKTLEKNRDKITIGPMEEKKEDASMKQGESQPAEPEASPPATPTTNEKPSKATN
ncbi:MAG: ComEA family DNA-binding protein [Candidatus Competibacteraceae bacterium]